MRRIVYIYEEDNWNISAMKEEEDRKGGGGTVLEQSRGEGIIGEGMHDRLTWR